MPTRALNVIVDADSRGLNRVLDQTESRTKRWGGAMAKGFAVAGAAAAGGLAVGLKKSADAAIEAEKAQATMIAQLRASGISYRAHAKQIDEVIQKHSNLSGLDDEDLQRSFTNIIRVTGDVDKSLRLTGLAADFARAKHMDVAKAGELIGKVAGGNIGILSRYGITLEDGATSAEALAVLQQKFAGQAAAYGRTTAGALDRAGVASENLGEIVGAKLTPLLAKGATALVNLVDKAGNLAGPIRQASGVVGNAFRRIVDAFSGGDKGATRYAKNVREMVGQVVAVARRLGAFIGRTFDGIGGDLRIIGRRFLQLQAVISEVVRFIARRTLPIVEEAIKGLAEVVRGVVKIIAGILSGDFRKVWEGVKLIVRGVLRALVGIIKGVGGLIGDALVGLGKLMIRALVRGLKGLPGAIKDAIVGGVKKGVGAAAGPISDVVGAINPFGDGIGKLSKRVGEGVGKSGMLLPQGGAFGGNLQGANPALGPFAALGGRFGLGVSSGRFGREGSITSSGNVSYHSTGEALDISGPAANMLRFARTVAAKYGGRLAELIHTPMGFAIKNGVRVAPYAAADHYDHVHVALDLGRPGVGIGDGIGRVASAIRKRIGDGLGRFESTAYGPPWNSMNGTGVTATGVDLRPARQAFGIAVDPSRLSLGRNYYVWPNPFGRRGPFKAFDTGGAIKGNRIDFYDWRGRRSQMSWGRRVVSVFTNPPSGSAGGGGTGGVGGGPSVPRKPGVGTFTGGESRASGGSSMPGGGSAADMELGLAVVGTQRARAEARDDLSGLITAMRNEREIKKRRLKRINKVLRRRKRMSKATRTRLEQERATLIGEIGDLSEAIREYAADRKGGATTISRAEELEAGVDTSAGTDGGGAAGGGGTDPALELSNRLQEEYNRLLAENNANQKRLIQLTQTQGPQLVGAVVAAVNGSIGGRLGLGGLQAAGVPGQVART